MIGVPLSRNSASGLFGDGDNVSNYATSLAQLLDVRAGTAATPDTTAEPLFKVSRTESLQASQITGDGVDLASTFQVGVIVPSTAQVQGVAIYGFGQTLGTYAAAGVNSDAFGGYFVGRSIGSSTRVGGGLFTSGRAEGAGSLATGIEVSAYNATGTDFGVLPASGYSSVVGIWLHATGTNRSGVGLEFGNPFGRQFDTGIEFSSQVSGGLTGPTFSNDIRSDSTSAVMLNILGTHAIAAIQLAAGSGFVALGRAPVANVYAVIQADADADVGLQIRRHSNTQTADIFEVASEVGATFFRVGPTGANAIAAGTATTAGGALGANLGSSPALGVYFGSGAPTVSAPQGSLYLRTDGSSTSTRAYVNNSAGSGVTWTAITTAA